MSFKDPEFRLKLTALVLFAIVAFIQLFPLGLHPVRGLVDTQDGLLNTWILGWGHHQLLKNPFKLFQADVFYPNANTLSYSEHLLPLTLLSLPLAVLGANPVLCYNFVFFLSCILNAYAMSLLVRHLTRNASAGIVAGLIFGFSTTMIQQISHLQLMAAWFIPLGLLYLHRFFEERKLRDAIVFAACLTLQALACIYYGLFFLSMLVVILPVMVWLSIERVDRLFWRRFVPPLAVGGGVMLLFSLPYLHLFRHFRFERPLAGGAELQNYLAAQTHNNLLGPLLHPLGSNEYFLFPGIVAVGLAALFLIGLRKRRTLPRAVTRTFSVLAGLNALLLLIILLTGGSGFHLGRLSLSAHNSSRPAFGLLMILSLWFLASTVMFLMRSRGEAAEPEKQGRLYLLVLGWALFLSFGSGFFFLGTTPFNQKFRGTIFSPFRWFYALVPGFKGIRMPSRYAIFVLLAVAVLAGWGWKRLSDRMKTSKVRTAALAVLVLALNAEFLSVPQRLKLVPVGRDIPPTYLWLRDRPAPSPVMELPLLSWIPDESMYMYFSLYHRQPLVNGYSGFIPYSTEYMRDLFGNFPSWGTIDVLQKLKVKYVVLHAKGYPPERLKSILHLVGKRYASRLRMVQVFHYDFGRPNSLEKLLGDEYVIEVEALPTAPAAPKRTVELRPDQWTVDSDARPDLLPRLKDGRADTEWTSGRPKHRGDYISITLDRPRPVDRVELLSPRLITNWAVNLQVNVSLNGRKWRVAAPGFSPGDYVLDLISKPRQSAQVIHLKGKRVRYIKIIQKGLDTNFFWCIPEVRIFTLDRSGRTSSGAAASPD
jgi:hypothetical protein